VESIFADLAALVEVIVIDLALSADNAIAVGMAASALPAVQRQRAVMWGVLLALVLRIVFGLVTVQLLSVRGLMLAGGLLLFWIAWRMYIDMRRGEAADHPENASANADAKPVTFTRALISIIVANIALSLDNVLAVAGVARHAPAIMVFGLVLSVVLMGAAATLIAAVVHKHRWVAYLGIAAIILAGMAMAWEDLHYFFPALPGPPAWLGGTEAAALRLDLRLA
jgi:YjbE family integral membrane protein